MIEWGLETSLQPRMQKMSWGTLFVDHPLRTTEVEVNTVKLQCPLVFEQRVSSRAQTSLTKSTVKDRGQVAELLRRKGGH